MGGQGAANEELVKVLRELRLHLDLLHDEGRVLGHIEGWECEFEEREDGLVVADADLVV